MKKTKYVCPLVEVMQVNTQLMSKTGEASLLPGPGTSAPERRTPTF